MASEVVYARNGDISLGHASFAFAGMTLMAFYLCGKLKVVGSRYGFAGFAVVGVGPIMVATLVAARYVNVCSWVVEIWKGIDRDVTRGLV